jgi:tetratricopeptide (TPR) repeat protein
LKSPDNKTEYINKANDFIDQALEIKPDDLDSWFNKGKVLAVLGRNDEALKAFEKAIEIKPDGADALYNRACAYSRMGEKEKALSDLIRAIEIDENLREEAKEDKDFYNLLGDENFKKLVGLRNL